MNWGTIFCRIPYSTHSPLLHIRKPASPWTRLPSPINILFSFPIFIMTFNILILFFVRIFLFFCSFGLLFIRECGRWWMRPSMACTQMPHVNTWRTMPEKPLHNSSSVIVNNISIHVCKLNTEDIWWYMTHVGGSVQTPYWKWTGSKVSAGIIMLWIHIII